MEKTIKSMMSLLEANIQSEIKNYIKVEFNKEIEEVIIDVLNKSHALKLDQSKIYLTEDELILKYKTTKTFIRNVMNQNPIERFKCGRFFMYNELGFINSCKKYKPNKPIFIKRVA
jgi:hypothetical protein